MRNAFLGLLLVAVSGLSSCVLPPGEQIGSEGAFIENTTGKRLFLHGLDDDGDLYVPGLELELHGVTRLEGPCTDGPFLARHSDDGPVIDSWEGELCAGDYWSIPQGGMVVNDTERTIVVLAMENDGETSYSIIIEAGRVGTLRAPCADPPITAGADRIGDLGPPRQEPLCVGDVWVIEES